MAEELLLNHEMPSMDDVDKDMLDTTMAKWPKQLSEMVDVLRADALERGVSNDDSMREACHTVILLAEYWGGQPIYIARNDKLRAALRNQQIYHEFTGDNTHALAKKYRLTTAMIYNIIKQQRGYRFAKVQPRLLK